MIKKKKVAIWITASVFLVAAIVGIIFIVLPLTAQRENGDADARKIALEQFGMEKVWFVSAGTSGSEFALQKTPHYPIYVIGERDGADAMVIVPQLKGYDAYSVEFPLQTPFCMIVEKINDYAGSVVCEPNHYHEFAVAADSREGVSALAQGMGKRKTDVNFLLRFGQYLVGEEQGEIFIIDINAGA